MDEIAEGIKQSLNLPPAAKVLLELTEKTSPSVGQSRRLAQVRKIALSVRVLGLDREAAKDAVETVRETPTFDKVPEKYAIRLESPPILEPKIYKVWVPGIGYTYLENPTPDGTARIKGGYYKEAFSTTLGLITPVRLRVGQAVQWRNTGLVGTVVSVYSAKRLLVKWSTNTKAQLNSTVYVSPVPTKVSIEGLGYGTVISVSAEGLYNVRLDFSDSTLSG